MVDFEKSEEKVCVKRNDEEWRAIQCPVLFINGENDPFGSCAELKVKVLGFYIVGYIRKGYNEQI